MEFPDCVVLLDAGTGIREAGRALLEDPRELVILVSHPHWDHIQGFPFFEPLYQQGRKVTVAAPGRETWAAALAAQIDGFRFPVDCEALSSELTVVSQPDQIRGAMPVPLSWMDVNHPGDCLGYRMETAAGAVVYLTDNELAPDAPGPADKASLVAFCADAALLVHDAQYLEDDLPDKSGWGHSTAEQVVALAREAGVARCALFHHDPAREDWAVLKQEALARGLMRADPVEVFAARDGMRVLL